MRANACWQQKGPTKTIGLDPVPYLAWTSSTWQGFGRLPACPHPEKLLCCSQRLASLKELDFWETAGRRGGDHLLSAVGATLLAVHRVQLRITLKPKKKRGGISAHDTVTTKYIDPHVWENCRKFMHVQRMISYGTGVHKKYHHLLLPRKMSYFLQQVL